MCGSMLCKGILISTTLRRVDKRSIIIAMQVLNTLCLCFVMYRHYCPGTPVVLVGMKKDLRQSVADRNALVPEDLPSQVAKEVGK